MEQDFSARLYRLRKERGISQEELADVVGVSRQAVQKWEAGASRPDMDNLTALGDFFGVSLDYLIRGAEPSPGFAPPRDFPEQDPWEDTEGGRCRAEYGDPHPWCWHYEYRSSRTVLGLPLLHVNIGRGHNYQARGVLAVGNSAVGLVAVGCAAVGLVSVGLVAVGVLTLACLGVGLLFCLGAIAVGLLAVGGMAVGFFSLGGLAVGYYAMGGCAVGAYAMGGCAVGAELAVGHYAAGRVAVGTVPEGEVLFQLMGRSAAQRAAIRQLILREFPRLPDWLAGLFAAAG